MKEIKRFLRNNIITAFMIYVVKVKFILFVKYNIGVFLCNISLKFNLHTNYANKILKIKNYRKGKKCIIVGNGPSVNFNDLDLISKSGIDSFGANKIPDIFYKTAWRPKYLCVMDPGFLLGINNTSTPDKYVEEARKNKIEYLFLTKVLKRHISITNSENIYYFNCPQALFFSNKIQPFSENAEVYVSDMGSVTQFMIQIAVYMGYKKIYLYGIDNTYTKYFDNDCHFKINNSINSHVEGMKTDASDKKISSVPKSKFKAYFIGGFADKRKNDTGYKTCAQYVENNSINIINLTRGGNLEFFERANFDDIF